MLFDFPARTDDEELMDDFTLGGDDFASTLDQIASINKWLGGNIITINALKKLFKKVDSKNTLRIIDAGCGNGDMCRRVVDMARKQGQSLHVIGIDANQYAVEYARSISLDYPEIEYQSIDIFSQDFAAMEFNVLLTTLTIHHFPDEVLIPWLVQVTERSKLGVVVNDLHRSKIAFALFILIANVFRLNKMNKDDGLVSIRRAFVKADLIKYDKLIKSKVSNATSQIRWKWAFRYLWTIDRI